MISMTMMVQPLMSTMNGEFMKHIVANLDSGQARLTSLRELQSETQKELDALLPSVLDMAFKGEL